MAVIKPDPDSDGECSPAFFHNPNDLLNLKEDEDCSFIKCAVTKFETEVSEVIILVGNRMLVGINSDPYCHLLRDISAPMLVMLLLVVGT